MTKYGPISVDNLWDDLTDEQKFGLWNFASSKLFYGGILSRSEVDALREELHDVVERFGLDKPRSPW